MNGDNEEHFTTLNRDWDLHTG